MAVVTWNPADVSTGCALSNGNLTATTTVALAATRATSVLDGGKFYFEATVASGVNTGYLGVIASSASLASNVSNDATSTCVYMASGLILSGGTNTGNTLGAVAVGTLLCVAIDAPNSRFWVRAGAAGQWNGSTLNGNPATGTGSIALQATTNLRPVVQINSTTSTVINANFGATAFTGTPPAGFAGQSTATAAWLTQIAAEQWASTNPQAQLTQIAVEQWAAVSLVNPQAVMTQIALEQWASVAQAGAAAAQARVMVMA